MMMANEAESDLLLGAGATGEPIYQSQSNSYVSRLDPFSSVAQVETVATSLLPPFMNSTPARQSMAPKKPSDRTPWKPTQHRRSYVSSKITDGQMTSIS